MPYLLPIKRPSTTRLAMLGSAVLLASFATACGDDKDASTDASGGEGTAQEITIAHQAFGESEIVAHIYGDALAANGAEVSYQSFKDRAAIYAALESGDVDLVPEYAASGLEFLNGNAGEASPDIDATAKKLAERLGEKDLAMATSSGAVDTNSLVVTKEASTKNGWEAISDLTAEVRLGGPQDCPTNAGCIPALKSTYGLDLADNFVPLDLGGPLTKTALAEGDIDVAVIFSTDASIADKGWVVLQDDKGIFNADNIVPVGTTAAIGDNEDTLDAVSAVLTTENVTQMNKRFDVDKEDAADIAADFIAENDLG